MVSREDLLAVANATGLAPHVVEKDYALGWVLHGISEAPALREQWIFKGGTCLKKCYFETYRFSEDLDFTLREAAQLDENFLIATCAEIAQRVYEESGFEIVADRTRFEIYENPRGHPSVQGRVYYRSHFQTGNNFPAIKLDLTADELLVDAAQWRPVTHPYPDDPENGMQAFCYSHEEIFAEKVRALGERTRARDLYDVVSLHRTSEHEVRASRVRDILAQKCAFKNIAIITLEIVQAARETVVATWDGMLRHQLPQLPPFDSFWDDLPRVFAWLHAPAQEEVAAARLVLPLISRADEEVLRPVFGGFAGIIGNASIMETIRFAAQSRLLVEIDYARLDGERRARTIEPYSLHRTQADEVTLYGFDVDADGIKQYRVERIHNARVLERAFTPRFAIELGPEFGVRSAAPARSSRSAGSKRSIGSPLSPGRGPFSANTRRPQAGSFGGPTYVFECTSCGKRFSRRSYDSGLNPHKTKDGWNCPGRVGYLVDTRYS